MLPYVHQAQLVWTHCHAGAHIMVHAVLCRRMKIDGAILRPCIQMRASQRHCKVALPHALRSGARAPC